MGIDLSGRNFCVAKLLLDCSNSCAATEEIGSISMAGFMRGEYGNLVLLVKCFVEVP